MGNVVSIFTDYVFLIVFSVLRLVAFDSLGKLDFVWEAWKEKQRGCFLQPDCLLTGGGCEDGE